MKRLLFVLPFLLGLTCYAQSERIIQKTVNAQSKKVEMKFSFADSIVVEAWDKNTIELKVVVNIDDNKYNQYYDLKINENGNLCQLTEDVNFKEIQKRLAPFFKPRKILNVETHGQWQNLSDKDVILTRAHGKNFIEIIQPDHSQHNT